MLSYKKIYFDLLKERDCLERHIETLSKARKERYALVCKNIENIKQPVSSSFMDKVCFVKENSISLDNLSNFSDYFFLDGTSVFLWYSSLVAYYIEGKMTEKENFVFLDMYKYSLKEDGFSSTLLYFQMVMRLIDKKLFCSFLGIKPYLYRDFYYSRFDKNVLEKIKRNLSRMNLSSFNTLQQREIKNFLSILEEKTLLLKDDAFGQEKNMKQMPVGEISIIVPKKLKNWQNKINEIIEYIRIHKVSAIPENACFSDSNYSMVAWYYNFLRKNCDYESPLLKEAHKKGIYHIVKELYNPSTVPLHEGVPFDYGSSLRKVLALYRMNFEQIFAFFKIPNICFQQIMENKIVPTEEFILKVLQFLNDLPVTDEYEKEFVDDAIFSYEQLKAMHLKGDKLTFTLYSEEREEEYLKLWKDFDSTILAQVRFQNYDWYLKCLTYFYICKTKERKPSIDDYFYDASSCYRWLTTQKSVVSGKRNFKISEDQNSMLKVVLQQEHPLDAKKESTEKVVLKNIDSFLDDIEKSIHNHGEILSDLTLKEIKLVDAWQIICQPLKNLKVSFSKEQIKRIKELRWEMIEKKKSNLNHFDTINFGYEISRFADGLHLTIDSLIEKFSFSRATIVHYMLNINLPSLNHTQKMLSVLEKFDLSLCRDDQVEDIAHFKKVLLSLIQYWQEEKPLKKEFFAKNTNQFTGILLKDVPISYLKEIYDTDVAWYEEFKKVYRIMRAGMGDDSFFFQLSSCRWFKREASKISLEESTLAKTELLRYLYFLYQQKNLPQKENRFMYKLIPLTNFIYENERIPRPKEFLLFDNTDGNRFYSLIQGSVYGTNESFSDLSDSLQEQMKLLLQYVSFCERRKRKNYQEDKIERAKFFLGERLENIRICLGFSRENFARKIGLDIKELFALYRNRISLKEQHVESLLPLFEEMKGKKLRRDQLEEMQDFIQVLTTKKLEDGFYLKFIPKE